MELIEIFRVVRRWLWLIVIIVVVTELALWQGTRLAEPVYAATVTLQISTPQREDVAAYDEYRSISLRDEITIAINNFTELLQNDEVRQRVVSRLGLREQDTRYTVAAKHVSDADFVNVTVEARTPDLAAEIAGTHVSIAITYYGELRAKTTNAEKDLFAEQLRLAEVEFHNAERDLADFRTEHGIYSLEAQISTEQELLEQLQLERDRRFLEQAATVIPTPNSTISITPTPAIDLVAEIDKLIAQRQIELDQFTALAPQYNILAQNVEQARVAYEHLLSKYSEAQLKVTAVQAANFMQVIKPAYAPTDTESSWSKLAVLTLAGSLGLGIMLAFFFDYLFSFKTKPATVPMSDQKTSSRRKQSSRKSRSTDAEQEPVNVQVEPASSGTEFMAASVTLPGSDHKTPTPRKRSGRKSRSTDAEQEPIDLQVQHGLTETNFSPASVTVPESDQKTSSRRKRSSRKTRSTDAGQEPIAVQSQYSSTETKVALGSDNGSG